MKIRTDYVSNSSSSSFVVVLPKEYDFKKFIKDVGRACVSKPDWDGYTKDDIARIKEQNIRNLDYCLNTHELLFLGTFCHDYARSTIKGKKKVADYLKNEEYLKEHCKDMFHDKIVSQDENKIVLEYPVLSSGRTIPNEYMYRIRQWQGPAENDKERFKDVVSAIVNEITKSSGHESHSGLYEVTMNTIFNTEALIGERPNDIKLDKWCSDLGALKKMIEDGDRIFGIDMHQSGDGQDSTSIYALAGWDSDAFKYANVQILGSECW